MNITLDSKENIEYNIMKLCNQIFIHTKDGKKLIELLIKLNLVFENGLPSDGMLKYGQQYAIGYKEGYKDFIRDLHYMAYSFNDNQNGVKKYE